MRIGDFIDEIKLALGETIDDAMLDDGAIAYHTGLGINKLRKRFANRMVRGNDARGLMDFVSTFAPITLETDATLGYRYFTMPGEIYDLPNGRGIDYISYYKNDLPWNCPPQVARAQFDATTWREFRMLYADPIEAPSPERPRYIQDPSRCYVFGVQPQVLTVQVGLVLAFDPLSIVDLDETIPLPPEAMYDLRRLVLGAGNWILLQPNERLSNDGRDFPVGQQKPQTQVPISVNDPIIVTPPEE